MTAFADFQELRRIPVFQNLPDDDLRAMNEIMFRQRHPAKSVLFASDQPAETMYIILSGSIKIVHESEDGGAEAAVILAILGAGEFVGEMGMVDGMARSATAVTRETTTLLRIGKQDFWDCLSRMHSFAFAVAGVLSRRVRVADAQIRSLATLDVRSRVARQLLAIAERSDEPRAPGGRVRLPYKVTQTELAEMVGATRTRVNQMLLPWKKAGVLTMDSDGRIVIEKPAALARFL